MKDFTIVVIILVIVFGGSFLMKNYLDKSGHEMISEVAKLSTGLETDDANTKNKNVEELKKKWDDVQKIWIIFQYHENINNTQDVLIECCNYYIDSNRTEFNISYEHFKRCVEDLKNREELSFENIL